MEYQHRRMYLTRHNKITRFAVYIKDIDSFAYIETKNPYEYLRTVSSDEIEVFKAADTFDTDKFFTKRLRTYVSSFLIPDLNQEIL